MMDRSLSGPPCIRWKAGNKSLGWTGELWTLRQNILTSMGSSSDLHVFRLWEGINANTGRTKANSTQKGPVLRFKPMTVLLCCHNANHWATVPLPVERPAHNNLSNTRTCFLTASWLLVLVLFLRLGKGWPQLQILFTLFNIKICFFYQEVYVLCFVSDCENTGHDKHVHWVSTWVI